MLPAEARQASPERGGMVKDCVRVRDLVEAMRL